MRLLAKLLLAALINLAGLLVSAYFIDGFTLRGGAMDIVIVAGTLTLLNFFLKPILKLIFGPVILLTLGLGIIIVNAVILKLLDFFSSGLTIAGIQPLLFATIILAIVNLILHSATRTTPA